MDILVIYRNHDKAQVLEIKKLNESVIKHFDILKNMLDISGVHMFIVTELDFFTKWFHFNNYSYNKLKILSEVNLKK